MTTQLLSPEAKQVLTIGRERHWGFRVREETGTIQTETYRDGWWYIPTDSNQIPKGINRLKEVNNVVNVKQVIIAHEAPRMLSAPKQPKTIRSANAKRFPWKYVLAVCGTTTIVMGVVTAVGMALLAAVALVVTVLPVVGMIVLFGAGLVIDPVLIAVLQDGTRIELMRWVEFSE